MSFMQTVVKFAFLPNAIMPSVFTLSPSLPSCLIIFRTKKYDLEWQESRAEYLQNDLKIWNNKFQVLSEIFCLILREKNQDYC